MGICLAATNSKLIEKAILQMNQPSVIDDPHFRKVNKTTAQNIDVNLFFNHKYLPGLISPALSDTMNQFYQKSGYAVWSEVDLTQKDNLLMLNGFSFSDETFNSYLDLFLYQKTREFTLKEYLPASTSFFLTLNLDNPVNYFKDYQSYLSNCGELEAWKSGIDEAVATSGVDLVKFVTDHLEGEVGVVYTRYDSLQPDENRLLVMKLNSGSNAGAILMNAAKLSASKTGAKDGTRKFQVDQETTYDIANWPVADFGGKVFGRLFNGARTSWFTIYDNCLIMGASYETVERYLRALVVGETLGNDRYFKDFETGMSQWSSFTVWFQPAYAAAFLSNVFSDMVNQSLDKQLGAISNIEAFGWQFGAENKMIYNTIKLKYNADPKARSNAAWRSFIGSAIISQPQFVTNPFDKGEKAVIFQDSEHHLIMVNKVGRQIWKVRLPSAIVGEVKTIDFLKDGKVQLLFNTRESIYLLDQKGNNLPNFPIMLRSAATNSVSVFDYDNRRDYRFCIAGEDHKIYLYDKKGNMVDGWEPMKSEHDVVQSVHHLRVGPKDYIVFFDKSRIYILDRKGKDRVTFDQSIALSSNDFVFEKVGKNGIRLIKTDREGNIHFYNFDGKEESLSVGKFTPEHHFEAADLNGDKKVDYIFLDENTLSAFDSSGAVLFTQTFEQKADPNIYLLPWEGISKVGVVIPESTSVLIYNSDGTLLMEPPLYGHSPFAAGFFTRGESVLNLLVGSSDGYLNNYQLKQPLAQK